MGYERVERRGDVTRFIIPNGNGADTIDLQRLPKTPFARQGQDPFTTSPLPSKTVRSSSKSARR